ncbi:MAG: hypothetical protein K6F91_03845 [Ruminococcus sp.]|nr:hypothetical protein [Ruminococcus sp.]
MSIVTVLFVVIFGLVLHFTRQNIERESVQMMRAMVFRPMMSAPLQKPDNMSDSIRLPFFTVNIADNGELTAFGGDYYDLTDKELLRELVNAADEMSDETGVLPEYDLRFLKADDGRMRAIVFADISSEKAMMNGLIRNSLIIGLTGYAVFLLSACCLLYG